MSVVILILALLAAACAIATIALDIKLTGINRKLVDEEVDLAIYELRVNSMSRRKFNKHIASDVGLSDYEGRGEQRFYLADRASTVRRSLTALRIAIIAPCILAAVLTIAF